MLSTLLFELPDMRLLALDAEAAELLCVESKDIESIALSSLFPDLTEEQWNSLFDQNDKFQDNLSTLVRASDGSKFLAQISYRPFSGGQFGLLLIAKDTNLGEHAGYSTSDALTGLPDRRALVAQFLRWQQSTLAANSPFALLFLDLDQFKQVNDQHGHATGDRVLATLSQRWQGAVREGDLIVRYGGDEFIVWANRVSTQEEVKPIVSRLKKLTNDIISVGNVELRLSVTIGTALSKNFSESLDGLIDIADRDMYALKPAR